MALSSEENLIVRLELLGEKAYTAGMARVSAVTERFAAANRAASLASETATKKSFLQQQAVFSARRGLFYLTLGIVGATAAIVKMGFSFQNSMQQARVALQPMFGDTRRLNAEINQLFRIGATTPFQFKDITTAFTRLYKSANLTVPKVNATIQGLADVLSSIPGAATTNNLNRVSTAIQHMLNIGHLIGQTRLQLNRLGIPLDYILKKAGYTSAQLENLGKAGIPAEKVLDAIIHASRTDIRFKDQALLTQLNTLSGAWSTFKDFLSQASAQGTGGLFSKVFTSLRQVDIQLNKMSKHGKTPTITNIVELFDKQLTPSSHALINAFTLIEYTLKGMLYYFGAFAFAVSSFFKLIDKVTFGLLDQRNALRLLGIALGIGIGLLITFKAVMIATKEAVLLARLAMLGYEGAVVLVTKAESIGAIVQSVRGWRSMAFAMGDVWSASRGMYTQGYKNNGLFARLGRTIFGLNANLAKGGKLSRGLALALRAMPVLTAITLAITLIVERKAIDKAVTGFLRSHHLGFFTGAQIDIFHTPYKDLPGFAKAGVASQIKTGKAQGTITPSQLAQLRALGYPGAAKGGLISAPGAVLVGEGGPEIVTLPAAAQISPNVGASVGGAPNLGFPEVLNLKAILRVDGKDIAQVVAQHRLDVEARR